MLEFFGIPMSFDPAAATLAVVGVFIAIQVYKATTFHRAKVVSVEGGWSRDVNGDHIQYGAVIRNTGLPIHEFGICLQFNRVSSGGRETSTRLFFDCNNIDVLEHGVQRRFKGDICLPLDDRSLTTAQWLQSLSEQTVVQTKPTIVLCSGDFDVTSIPLVSRFDRSIQGWNRIASWVNSKFDRYGEYEDGQAWVKSGKLVPKLGLSAWFRLQEIGRLAQRELNKKNEDSGLTEG